MRKMLLVLVLVVGLMGACDYIDLPQESVEDQELMCLVGKNQCAQGVYAECYECVQYSVDNTECESYLFSHYMFEGCD